jgi:hypothetical protein
MIEKTKKPSHATVPLKVVCNEKEGGPGNWQTLAIGIGL